MQLDNTINKITSSYAEGFRTSWPSNGILVYGESALILFMQLIYAPLSFASYPLSLRTNNLYLAQSAHY